jgi:hypothetical protein
MLQTVSPSLTMRLRPTGDPLAVCPLSGAPARFVAMHRSHGRLVITGDPNYM